MVKVPLMGLGLAVVCALGVTARAESGSQQFAAVRSVPFSLAAPAGPQFTDAQKTETTRSWQERPAVGVCGVQ